MATNMVEMNYSYSSVKAGTSEKIMSVFEELMLEANNRIKLDNLYTSKQLTDIIGSIIPAPTLTALVNRGMLHCDGKFNGKNVYAITAEIYNYYIGTYKLGKDKFEARLNKQVDILLTNMEE